MVRGSWEERLADMQARILARHGRGGGRAMTRAAVAGEPPAAPLPGGAAVSGYDGGEGAERVSVPLSGDTRLFAVVGDPVGQVRSPLALTRRLAARGENAIVAPLHVTPRDLAGALAGLALVANLGGLLVTVPHKAAAFALCAAVSGRARFVGSVNVMRKGRGGWYGDNADGWGYAEGLAAAGFAVSGCSALVLGCGGAGSAVALELLGRGGATGGLNDGDAGRRGGLAGRLAARFPGRVRVGGRDPSGFDLVANVTPMGMRTDDPLPVDVDKLEPEQFVACAITRPEVSATVVEARRRGCRTMTGAAMFDGQADFLADFLLSEGHEIRGQGAGAEISSPSKQE